jgi:hypothetical protein
VVLERLEPKESSLFPSTARYWVVLPPKSHRSIASDGSLVDSLGTSTGFISLDEPEADTTVELSSEEGSKTSKDGSIEIEV